MKKLLFAIILIPFLATAQTTWYSKTLTDWGGSYLPARSGTLLQLVGSDATYNTRLSIDNYGTTGILGSAIIGRTATGTPAAPGAVGADKVLLSVGGVGYGSTSFSTAANASITFRSVKSFTDTDYETYITFSTTGVGSTANTERMRLKSNGNLQLFSYGAGFLKSDASGNFLSSALSNSEVTTALGFTPYNATNPNGYISAVPAQAFASLTGKPTTLGGYGITDAYPLTGNPSSFITSVPAQTFASITSKPTTLSGYGISDGLTSATAASTYQPIGSYLIASSITGKVNYTDTSTMLDAYKTAINGKQPVGNYASGVTNTGDNAANTTYANDYRAANFVAGTNYLVPNGSAAALTSIPVANATGVLPYANGGITGLTATTASTGTVSVPMASRIFTVTPTGAITFNAAVAGTAGQEATFIITTSGTTSFVITFGTKYRTQSTLSTGTVTAKRFCISFISDGTVWSEVRRTTAL